ncbi:hypothetical protein TWF694_003633 [Orbilia ellipsospora]|uniref:CBM1 domain-containing protein n=1 Tax=Orbilia ellipsospora TaxID=2528407 RepID=A0AAV9X108_9PEZI
MKWTAIALFTAVLFSVTEAQQSLWGQCGGKYWDGAKTCVPGTTCTCASDYYCQCVPLSTTLSTTTATTSKTTNSAITTTTEGTVTTTSTVTTTTKSTTSSSTPTHTAAGNSTHCGTDFCTWWHNTGEINTLTRVQPGNVRQSHRYLVYVSAAGANNWSPSFIYEAIPRNGMGRLYSPWDPIYSETQPSSVDDGITIEPSIGLNMAWSQFEFAVDVDVKINRRDGVSLGGPSNVVIRPTSITYSISSSSDGGIIIRVPATTNGAKFSVEFNDDLYTFRSDGNQYVTSGGDVVGIEPTNALLIFASPFIPANMMPPMNAQNTKQMTPGPINVGDWGSSEILYFPPGVYWMNQDWTGNQKLGQTHLKLDSKTYWVHFAPGAYVKGAVEYSTGSNFYATGHGVLSGEHYVYQANPQTYYQSLKSDQYSLRMWGHYSLKGGQTWYCVGPTITAPPFNTMDFYGSNDITTRVSDYKQTGAFWFQTDGPAVYPNSVVHDIFYHVNDDAIKTYYSGVSITRATIWKAHNDPIIQMGWTTRNIQGITIDTLNVIHTRYIKSETYVPSAIIGASPFYAGGSVDPSQSIGMTISNLVCEGPCPAFMRITPLQSYKNFIVKGVSFPDGFQAGSIGTGQSIIPAANGITMNLNIQNWTVKGQKVTMSNFGSLGQFNIDVSYWGQWSIA